MPNHPTPTTPTPEREKISAEEFIRRWKEDPAGKDFLLNRKSLNIENVSVTGTLIIDDKSLMNIEIKNSDLANIKIQEKGSIAYFSVDKKSTTGNIDVEGTVGHIDVEGTVGHIRIWIFGALGFINMGGTTEDIWVGGTAREVNIYGIVKGRVNISGIVKGRVNILGIVKEGIVASGTIGNISVNCENVENITINTVFIQYFTFTKNKYCKIHATNAKFGTVIFAKGSSEEHTLIQFENCETQNLIFDAFTNNGFIRFNNLKFSNEENEKGQLLFKNSDLGKTSFMNCELAEWEELEYINTKMQDVFVAGTLFPTKIGYPDNETVTEKAIKEQKHLAYAQLKKMYENQGETATALRFKALELEAYRELLKEKDDKSGLKRTENWTLWLNFKTNRHGSDWRPALTLFLFCSIATYLFNCWILGLGNISLFAVTLLFGVTSPFLLNFYQFYDRFKNVKWVIFLLIFAYFFHWIYAECSPNYRSFDNYGLSQTFTYISLFFEYINPIYSTDLWENATAAVPNYVKNDIRLNTVHIIHQFNRIIGAYLLFQLIAAFRKFGKSE